MRRSVVRQHKEIADAILAGRGDDAERLMRGHMEKWAVQNKKIYSVSLEERVIWGD
jgi:DNA-binding GntR family transcriptional regulator